MAFSRVQFNSRQFLKREMPKMSRIPSIVNLAKANAKRRFESKKKELLEEVLESDAAQELLEGPEADSSKFITSVGDVPTGNLFSFIGFYANSNPVDELIEIIDLFVQFDNSAFAFTPRAEINRIDYTFQARVPSVQELGKQPKLSLPWESGLSWIEGIENGISGIGNYLFDLDRVFRTSRSGPAIQAKSRRGQLINIGKRIFAPAPFLTPIFERFRERLRQ